MNPSPPRAASSPAKADIQASATVNDDVTLADGPIVGLKWYRFWVYVCVPLSIVLMTGSTIVSAIFLRGDKEAVLAIGLILGAAVLAQMAILYGMLNWMTWAWWLNCVSIAVGYSLVAWTGVGKYSAESDPNQRIMRLLAVWILWILPNLVYWKKRKFKFVAR